ncbi:alkaline phosphatase-like [Oppia nitens]|uniref:alkaline phosphatase-like n=1 Tax=Oppia nitens TaxID=1686743 RepID=UPI0023D9D39C|nr:alkaline phosphatase-like [Oppia nitens]
MGFKKRFINIVLSVILMTLLLPSLCLTSKIYASNKAEIDPQYWIQMAKNQLKRSMNQKPIVRQAKNAILFIGDGMGITTITPARILKGQLNNRSGEETKLIVEDFPYVSLIKTYNVDNQVTDSAASANAFLTGIKTNDGTIGVNARVARYSNDCQSIQQNSIQSILQWAIDSGKSAGLVTTAQITDATPAASYAHISNRDWESTVPLNMTGNCKDIARQLIEDQTGSELKVILGGARRFFLPEDIQSRDGKYGARRDGRNLIDDWLKTKKQKGFDSNSYKFVETNGELKSVDTDKVDYLFGLFNYDHLSYDRERDDSDSGEPSLELMVETAVKILSKNKNGYVLLVEAGNIDKAHHDNYAQLAIHDTVAFDKAITKATSMASHLDTLMIVTADHSHTLSFNGYSKRGNDILGVAGNDSTNKPYTTLMYGNGPGYQQNRDDPSTVDTRNPRYQSLSAVHLDSNAHGGEDVAAYSAGPMAHLLSGTNEQSYIAHVIAFATCIGDYKGEDHCHQYSAKLLSASHQNLINTYLYITCLLIVTIRVFNKF